jgi:hexosaminidase
MLKRTLLSTVIMASLAACSSTSSEQSTVNQLAENLDVNYTVITNQGADDGLACKELQAEWASCNKVTISTAFV